jgi:tetratricopeptide (TPR) repeat protein
MSIVKIWEENIVMPTYEVGKPDKNPMFLENRVYQGSSGKIYPYPATQEISKTKTDKAWKAVILENQYIQVTVLPELGGRIQRAVDKTNNYDFVYYNHVIKPALVGILGPWISGGIEFNWPQHHRPTTYMPVDYEIRDNEDGSKSLLLHDVDQMNGTKAITIFTLYPDKAFIEVTGQLYNRTPMPQTFLWWANPAVAVNDFTQSVFPPDVHNVYDHGKRAVSRFPIATGEYYKYDYSEGVDISRYKNIPVPTSYMAEKSDYDFVGGYDYQKQAGLLHVADHHISPGKKQWTWGNGDFGRAWDRNLTDADGPYIELMTGMYCDNQPDFTWLKPFEEKVFRQYFMPYKAAGYVKNASIHAILNMEVRDRDLYLCVYATELYDMARLTVRYKGEDIYTEDIRISPTDVYEKTLPLQIDDPYEVKVVVSYRGEELVSYQPQDQGIPEIAQPAQAPDAPEKVMTNEELYLIGEHIEQYRHATWLPDPYYLEGLKRDPGDVRINNTYGLLLFRRGLFAEAEQHFLKAIERLTRMHPNPYFGEPYYNLGLSLFYQERFDEAYSAFYKATWTSEEQEMAFYYLAVIATRRKDYRLALEFVEKGLVKNVHNIKARGLKAMLLAKLGRDEDALAWIEENLRIDNFDYVSMFAKIFIVKNQGEDSESYLADVLGLMRNFHESFLQTARDLAEVGFYTEALQVLDAYEGDKPLIHYYKSFYWKKMGKIESAQHERSLAEAADPAYTFPNKLEDLQVLSAMIEEDSCAKALYYLGNLYYDKLQYEKAIALWEKSLHLDDTYPTLLRNLAIAYYNKAGKKTEAKELLEKAFSLDDTDARVFLELDQLYKKLNVTPAERLEAYRKHFGLVESRDDLYTEYITLLNLDKQYQKAYDEIMRHHFQTWEGAEGKITTQFKTALSEMAKEALKREDYRKAKELLEQALSYPENLGEGRLEGTKDNDLYYLLGCAYEAIGEKEQAQNSYDKATLGAVEPAGMLYYYDQPADMILYQGLAKEKLDDHKAANARFYKLIDFGERHIRDTFKKDYFAVSVPDFAIFHEDMDAKNEAHCRFLMGLGRLGLKDFKEAANNFRKALEIDPYHQKAEIYLKMAESEEA